MSTDPIATARKRWFAACREAGLDEAARRAVQVRVCGKDSAAGMGARDFNRCLDDLKARKLWKPTRRAASGKAHIRLVFALWGELGRMGVVRDPSPAGLRAFCRRMAQVDDPEW
ncbi:MAG: regulatory protein GemA, partial [Magnetospirillum sp.]|nr:regulatory protein GemA [Magnetospirillum sp.]